MSVIDVPHASAVDALKKAGNVVKLHVKRKRGISSNSCVAGDTSATAGLGGGGGEGSQVIEIDLIKNGKGLGFSIAGGIGNQHIPGDNGIYVTKIMEGGAAAVDGRLAIGDKLIAVRANAVSFVLHSNSHV